LLLLVGAIGFHADSVPADPLDHWTRTNVGTNVFLRGLAYGNGRFVAVGEGGAIFQSVDCLSWSRVQSAAVGSLRAIACGNGRFVVTEGSTYEKIQNILTSPDGTNWTRHSSPFPLNNIVFGRGLFVAVALENALAGVSTNGLDWNWQYLGSTFPLGIGMNDTLFMVAGNQTFTSPSGSNWVAGTRTFFTPSSIAYGNGTFVCVSLFPSYPSNPYTTTDGLEWTLWPAPGPIFSWGAVAFAHNTFVISGNTGVLLTSTTGTNWVERAPGQFYNEVLPFVTYAQGRVIAVGGSGTVLVSDHYGPALVTIEKQADLRLKISAQKNKLCVIEQSTDFQNWTELSRYTNSTETTEIGGIVASNSATIFRVLTD